MYILGINAYHGDAAAAIVRDGELIAAVEEERFNRVKHSAGFPTEAVRYCLKTAGVGIEEVEHIGISRDPSAHLHKKVLFAVSRAAKQAAGGRNSRQEEGGIRGRQKAVGGKQNAEGSAVAVAVNETEESQTTPATTNGNGTGNGRGIFAQIKDRLGNAAKVRDLKGELAAVLSVSSKSFKAQFHNIEHHRAHLASSFYVSPFERAALLSIDGFGDFVSTMWALGEGNSIKVLDHVEYPHSTGIVYTATTQFLGFPYYGDEGKVMGLAPYGRPSYIEQFRKIIRTESGGKFKLDLNYFRHHAEGVEMTWDQGSPVIGRIYSDAYTETFGPAREPGVPITDRERDIAASLQQRLEEVGFHVMNHLHEQTGLTDLGLSGGVAYNSVMNGKILLNTPFRRVFVQPAAGDSGTALGVCYELYNRVAPARWRSVEQAVGLRGDARDAENETGAAAVTGQSAVQQREGQEKERGQAHLPNLEIARSLGGAMRPPANGQADDIEIKPPADAGGSESDRHAPANAGGSDSHGHAPADAGGSDKNTSGVARAGVNGNAASQTNSLLYGEASLRYVMETAYTGPEFTDEEIVAELEASNLQFETYTDEGVTKRAARDIADGLVVGWFQGRMEFGPRALGNRSIVVDPRRADMKDILNQRIKKREPFRPFAPSILEERTGDYFEQSHPSPTMLMVYQVRPERRAEIPAVTHVDGSGRLQTVSREGNLRYYQLISDFNELTGTPIVLNTSFNENEPIVCTPRHAIDCFMKTRMDVLYIGNQAVRRN
jgi:predicted NodU family carbamoyl transferase